jgi:hypothetical protein
MFKKVLISLLVSCVAVFSASGRYWNTGLGGVTMQFLSMQVSPRSAALSGAGVADASRISEVTRNPLALTGLRESEFGLNQIIFGDAGADNFVSVYYGLPLFESLALSFGLEYLGYDDLEGRDEEGMLTGDYGAYAWALQAGAGNYGKAFGWSLSARFAYQAIDDESTLAILGDAGVVYRMLKYLSFGATITNFGYVTDSEFSGEHEAAPMALQAGVTGIVPVSSLLGLESLWEVHVSADAYRRADMDDSEWRFGMEVAYQEFLLLRAGYAARPHTEDGFSAGLGFTFGRIVFDYGYSPRPALGDGNHYLGLGVRF